MAPFLRNQWYTAATSTELGAKPLARTICKEPMVIFRAEDGAVAVLTDGCPHRKAPLSLGEVVGNAIPVRLSRHPLRRRRRLRPRARECRHRPQFPRKMFSRARSPWTHFRVARRAFAGRPSADP